MTMMSRIERMAMHAEELSVFSGIKIAHIRKKVEEISGLIGRDGIFSEYTLHDMSHIDKLIQLADWLIPETTHDNLTATDYLLITLSIYMHDLGMLVTKNEFDNRHLTDFKEFVDNELFNGDAGKDYKAKVYSQYKDEFEREKFLYQEFVRKNHAKRIRHWINGDRAPFLGENEALVGEIQKLLPDDQRFKDDLAIICESHHLDDLDNYDKYKIDRSYGPDHRETGNVHYAAIILRSADLLHMTNDRTPTTMFRIISPSDPVSQIEWAKQMAVKRVKAQPVRNQDGILDHTLKKDTIEVDADFTNANAFFGLISYIVYCRSQIKKCYEWSNVAQKVHASKGEYPWKHIDDSKIETRGFEPRQFSFTLDQHKIIELLTGHTLYNDSSVVVRELVQNSLDAVRLKRYIVSNEKKSFTNEYKPRIKIIWNSKDNTLQIIDNGVGMTKEIVEQYFLKVGSSIYQDESFRNKYHEYSSISRFGIGVLSCFMVADDVEVWTSTPDEPEIQHLTLRSAHGKYLIKFIKKTEDLHGIVPHGTAVQLKLRPSSSQIDILGVLKKWIVIPEAEIIFIDDDNENKIGYHSLTDALEAALFEIGYRKGNNNQYTQANEMPVKIVETMHGSVQMAIAVQWNEIFETWSFLELDLLHTREQIASILGIAIEGIRVEDGTPGYNKAIIAAMANAKGPNAPKTNVARSNIESTPEFFNMILDIYTIYCSHVTEEIARLISTGKYSYAWVSDEAIHILYPIIQPLSQGISESIAPKLLIKAVSQIPMVTTENNSIRSILTVESISQIDEVWTIDWKFVDFANSLIRESTDSVSIGDLTRLFPTATSPLPDGVILENTVQNLPPYSTIYDSRQVTKIVIHKVIRRVDLLWSKKADHSLWYIPNENKIRSNRELSDQSIGNIKEIFKMSFAESEVDIVNNEGFTGVTASGHIYLFHNSELNRYLAKLVKSMEITNRSSDYRLAEFFTHLILSNLNSLPFYSVKESNIKRLMYNRGIEASDEQLSEFIQIMQNGRYQIFSPAAWSRDNSLSSRRYDEDEDIQF